MKRLFFGQSPVLRKGNIEVSVVFSVFSAFSAILTEKRSELPIVPPHFLSLSPFLGVSTEKTGFYS